MRKRLVVAVGILIVLTAATITVVLAHGGGLAADGCHYDRSIGVRHCHRSPGWRNANPTPTPYRAPRATPTRAVPIRERGWPSTCVYLNDIVEAHLGNFHNVGVYQRTYRDPNKAEAACRADHRNDVHRTFGWAFR